MRRQARRESSRAWIASGATVTIKAYARRYGVDRHTAYEDLTAIGFPLPDSAQRWTTLAWLPGVRQDRRWAFRVSMICRVVDTVTSAPGILAGPGIGFAVVGGFGVALSVLAIVLLVRLSPARALRRAATSA